MGDGVAGGGDGMRYPVESPYAYEAEEARDAARFENGTCARNAHKWASNHRGGGICLDCGETVDGSELP